MRTELADIAANNGGPFTRRQAMQAGYTPMAIRHRLRRGEWVVLRTGVYAAREVMPQSPRRRHALDFAAAVLAVRSEGAAASHRSAAYLHGMDLLSVPRLVTLTRPPGDAKHADKPGIHVHRARLPPGHTVRTDGLTVTSLARTVVDLGRTLSFREAVVAGDSAMRLCGARPGDIETVLNDCRNWPGICRAARVVSFVDPLAESALESLARVLFAEAGLPTPRTQVVLGDEWGAIGRVDFYWPEYGVVVEVDGMGKYRNRPDALVAEKQRQERLERAGYIVRRLTWNDIVRFPKQAIRRIREALALAETVAA